MPEPTLPNIGVDSPIPPFADGTCAPGYVLNNVDGLCYLVGPAVSVTATGVSLPDVDPRNASELAGLGTKDSGLPYLNALAHWQALKKTVGANAAVVSGNTLTGFKVLGDILSPFVYAYMSVFDILVAAIASFLSGAKTRDNPLFWQTIGSIIEDLLGTPVDGTKLYTDSQGRGTIAAMADVGAALVNLLIGEFTGTAGGTGGEVTVSSNADPVTGLPIATLTPRGGIVGIQALMGFVLSSSVRQANIEGLTDNIPYGFGKIFEKYSEAMRTNLGIGRMLRFAMRPIFQILLADPAKWAFNMTYRPARYNLAEAARAFFAGTIQQADFLLEAAQLGYSDARALAIMDTHSRKPQLTELQTLWAVGQLAVEARTTWLLREGFDTDTAALAIAAADLEPARKVSLALAEHYMLEYGKGSITSQALKDFIDGMKGSGFLLTPGEVTGLEAVAAKITANVKLRVRQLSLGQLKQAYIDGTITLDEYETHAAGLGYSASDVQILGIEVLLAAKKAQAAAAKKAAAGLTGNPVVTPTPPGTTGTPGTPTTPAG